MANKFNQNIAYRVYAKINGNEFELGSNVDPADVKESERAMAVVNSNLKAYVRELIDNNYGTQYAEIALPKVQEYLFTETGKYSGMFIPEALRSSLEFRFDEVNTKGETVRKLDWVKWNDVLDEHTRYNAMVSKFMESAKLLPVHTGIDQDVVKSASNQPIKPVVVAPWAKPASPAKEKTAAKS